MLGELQPSRSLRLKLTPLSVDAVSMLAGETDAATLHRQTGGNPFFVTEVVASAGADVPPTVREAVLARASRLGPSARTVLQAVAVVVPAVVAVLFGPLAVHVKEVEAKVRDIHAPRRNP